LRADPFLQASYNSQSYNRYSVVLDLNTLDIHLYYDGKFEKSYLLNVKSELSKVSGKKMVPMTEVLASKINN